MAISLPFKFVDWRGSVDVPAFLAMAIFWGINYPLVKIALEYVDPYQLLFLRLLVALPFLALLTPRSLRPPGGLRTNLLIALFGALDVLLMQLLWFSGEDLVSPSMASLIIYTYPVLVTVLGAAILGERMTRLRALGLAFGFLGMMTLFSGGIAVYSALGLVLLSLAALSWSFATIVYRKYLLGENFARVNAYHLLYVLPAAAILAFLEGGPGSIVWSPHLVVALIMIGFPGTALAFTIYVYLYSRHEVGRVAPYMFLVPAFSIISSYMIMGAAITAPELAGYSLLAAGIYFSSRAR